MTTETKFDLNASTLVHLQDLLQINIDSAAGFREAADKMNSEAVAETFRQLAVERLELSEELQGFVAQNSEEPRTTGSFLAAFHRILIDIRALLNGGDTYAILCEAERGEHSIKQAYESAMVATAGSAVTEVLNRQFLRVKAGHDRVREMREHFQQH